RPSNGLKERAPGHPGLFLFEGYVPTLAFIEDDLGMLLSKALYLKEIIVAPAAIIYRFQVQAMLSEKSVEIRDKITGSWRKGVDLLLVQPVPDDFDKDAFLGQVLVKVIRDWLDKQK